MDPIDDVTPARPKKRWWRWVLVAVLAAALGVGGYAVVRQVQKPRTARDRLVTASALLSEAEPDVLAIDSAVRSEVTSALAQAAADAAETIDPTQRTLTRALSEIAAARPDLGPSDLPLADALESAVQSRLDMLGQARFVLATDARVSGVVAPASDAWQLIAEGEKLADDAVAQYNKHTKAGVQESMGLTTRAETAFTAARSALGTVTAGMPEADMGPFVAYVDAKVALLASSRKIDATWLAGKVEEANGMLDAYNVQERAVIALAQKLPESPTAVVAEAYKSLTGDAMAQYFEARDAARAADAKVKELQKNGS